MLDFMSALLHGYEYAEKIDLVDNQESDSTQLLPIYHTNLKSTGSNIIMVTIKNDGSLVKAEFVGNGEYIVFPVTQDSVARAGKNPPSHPLVDKFSYLFPLGGDLYNLYQKTSQDWRHYDNPKEITRFLTSIHSFLASENALLAIFEKLYSDRLIAVDDFTVRYKDVSDKGKLTEKKIDFSSVFLTFTIEEFNGFKNMNVTEYRELHQAYIDYVESLDLPRGVCNISGEEQQLTIKHRGLLGNAKLISVSNNTETYKGRFSSGEDIIKIGYRTSEKIHLMLKYLLENNNSHKWLGGQQHLINWFSDDIGNQSQIEFVNPFGVDFYEEYENQNVASSINKKISDSFIRGEIAFSDNSNYYIAIVDKASNGRISLKFFRELKTSQLLDNLGKWQENNQWEYYDVDLKRYRVKVPSMRQMIAAAYGIERKGMLEIDNDSFQKDQFQKLVVSLIDGKPIPDNILKNLESNIKNRLSYPKTWKQLLYVTLGLFHNKNKEGLKPMLDKQNMNRSYLFGRLLAVFDRMEAASFNKNDEKRVTNAQKFWTSYTNHPASTMQILLDKTKYYERTLLQSNPGLKIKLEKEKIEIINLLSANYLESKDVNRALDYHFIFGYYAEEKFIYSKTNNESEEKTC